jgi:transcriptional regulator with XRE-family HTH domain
MVMTKEEIGEKLKAARLSCGMTQQEVANKIGRKQPIIGHWETGYSQPDANTLFTLCDIFGTTVDEVFGFKKKDIDISKKDIDMIEKYQFLDPHGKDMVDTVLNKEHERCKSVKQKNIVPIEKDLIPEHLIVQAAHNDSVIDDEELEKMQEDLELLKTYRK